ncbi:DUF5662 family protein, partial [Hungatella sp. SL.1.14]|uniref:DUF5662 family protein n=1 Tax=Hungatella sp. SL.1.14 TaxID=2963703 RepID=UPI00210C67F9
MSNVEAGFRWLQKNLPEITEGSGAEHNIVFAHDQSKKEPDEYGPYDIYFYGGNRSYGVVEDFRKAWLLHIHRNPHHWQYWVLWDEAANTGQVPNLEKLVAVIRSRVVSLCLFYQQL